MKKLLLVLGLITVAAHASDEPRNRLQALVGAGPKDVTVEQVGNSVVARENVGFLYGISYERKLDNKVIFGSQVLNNGTVLGTIGFDF